MGRDSSIEWTHHTFNPWWGCTKVSPACNHCYAEAWARRMGLAVWGSTSERRFFGDAHWRQPLVWNRHAAATGLRARVFCASMADVFEDRPDLVEARSQLWATIEATPALDWLLLTKRPANAAAMVPWTKGWPSHVWLGTTVESSEWATKRIPALLQTPAAVRFLSCEPLLEAVDLTPWFRDQPRTGRDRIHWVILGGESGRGARPMQPDWARALRDQCQEYGVLLHFKQ